MDTARHHPSEERHSTQVKDAARSCGTSPGASRHRRRSRSAQIDPHGDDIEERPECERHGHHRRQGSSGTALTALGRCEWSCKLESNGSAWFAEASPAHKGRRASLADKGNSPTPGAHARPMGANFPRTLIAEAGMFMGQNK